MASSVPEASPAAHGLLDPAVETLAPEALRRLQDRDWPAQWEHLRRRSAFYRERLGAWLDRTVTLDGLEALPTTDKEAIRESQERHPPYGEHVACAEERIVRLHRTSGMTGRALIMAQTAADAATTAAVGARSMRAGGLRPGHRVIHCLNYCLWTGGVTDHLILEAAGATVIPFGVGNTNELLQMIPALGANAISCTPSYPALMEKLLAEAGGPAPRELGLKLALFGGEGGLDNPAFRRRLESVWGFKVRNANYGLSEVMSILGGQCEATNDLHFHAGDAIFAELLDPATGARLPIREGTVGELVATHLRKECQPLLRYRTRDLLTVTGTGPCACGRTGWRFRVTGRTDDMFKVRGVNVFPSAVRAVIADHPALSTGHFRIRLAGPGPYDRIQLTVEAAPGLPPERWEAAARTLEAAIRLRLAAGAHVSMVAAESLPRTAGKTNWIERIP
jgi:phenylacetate-CoA ligase